MVYKISVPELDNTELEIRLSFVRRTKVYASGRELKQLKEKGQPFQLALRNGSEKKIYLKRNGIDYLPKLKIDNKEILLAKQLSPFEYIWSALPLLLVFVGGFLGGFIGAIAMYRNMMIFRTDMSRAKQIIISSVITIAAVIVWFVLGGILYNLSGGPAVQ